ncbi:MAG: hypothetical protein ACOVOP_03775 [Candidatus Planktophila sp.]|jgi:hypothetical protein
MKKKRRITGKNQRNKKKWEKLRQRGVYSIETLPGGGLVGNNVSG